MTHFNHMNANEYQEKAKKTALYPKEHALPYLSLGLIGEAGEVANKVKKIIRDDNSVVTPEKREDLRGEIGDVLWYCAMLCEELDMNLGDAMSDNITKLYDRLRRGKIGGSGDKR